jgi:lysophospholipase L1-like esterase
MTSGVYIAGDSHAQGLVAVLEHEGADAERGRRTSAQPALPLEPAWVVVSLGTNDRPGPALVQAVRELAATRRGRPLVWMLPPYATRADLRERRPAVAADILDGLRGVENVLVVDPQRVPLSDGVHTTRAGYRLLAEQISTAIAAAERSSGQRPTNSSSGTAVVPFVLSGLLLFAAVRWLQR